MAKPRSRRHQIGECLLPRAIEDRRLVQGVKSALAADIPRGAYRVPSNKEAKRKQRLAEQFFLNGFVSYQEQRDPTGTPSTIHTLEELSKHISKATLTKAKVAITKHRQSIAQRHARIQPDVPGRKGTCVVNTKERPRTQVTQD